VLALALLIVGGYALIGALRSKPSGSLSSAPASNAAPQAGAASKAPVITGKEALVIKVTGPTAYVFVSAPGSANSLLFRGYLSRGDIRTYDAPSMAVVVNPVENTNVFIHGTLVSKGATGKKSWTVG
jgi:hypothetical protein